MTSHKTDKTIIIQHFEYVGFGKGYDPISSKAFFRLLIILIKKKILLHLIQVLSMFTVKNICKKYVNQSDKS